VNGTPSSQIQIIAPFKAALEWMKMMLFRPFDFAKWLTIAFAAFIGGHWGNNFRVGQFWNRGDWNYRFRKSDFSPGFSEVEPWLIALIAGLVLFGLVLGVVLAWVSARGRFMFTDCIVKNRGAIAEPWHEFRREGNSYFVFTLVVGLCFFVLLAIMVLCGWLVFGGMFDGNDGGASVIFIVVAAVLALFWIVLSILFALVAHFMVPVMYRRRCSARKAFFDVVKLVSAHPGPFVLFALFSFALVIAVGIIGTTVACMTCCIGGLPYVSTVILLPAIVWLATYKLLFIRQFGDAYDVWANVAAPVQTAEPLPPPSPAAS
jgi:hypothetical protein